MLKRKETFCFFGLLAGILLILGIGFLPFFIIRTSFITSQKNMIGVLYEKDAALCEEILRYAFEEDIFSKQTNNGTAAMLSLGYTQKGFSYLFQKTGWGFIYLVTFLFQGTAALLILFLFYHLLKLQKEAHRTLISDIKKGINTKKDLNASAYPFFKKDLIFTISDLLHLLHVKENSLLEKSNRTQEFIENIAHQIKTPLSCIFISMDLLLETADETQKDQVFDCFKHLENIQALMKKLLDIGRLEAGKILMQKENLHIDLLLEECLSILPDGNARIAVCREDKKAGAIIYYGDYEWLKEAFLNILKNCLEHDGSGEKILLFLSQTAEGIKITIKDHGKGISKDDLPHIFDRFYLPKHAKKSHSGIGLNLAKLIIDHHFGSLHAANCEAGGAVFTVLLPVFDLKNRKI